MPVSFYEVVWIFMIYAFLGWCTEVAYAALETKKFVNRGFLNGPVCPVYGCGVLVVVVVLTPLKEKFIILFIGSFLLTSVIEFITGFLLEKLFHNQWWDYSNQNFNICGYVCLKFSILWGLACTLIMDVIHPTVYKLIRIIPKIPGTILLVVLCIIFGVDLVITVGTILKFNQRLKLLDEMAVKLKVVSNEIGENIYEGVTVAMEKGEEFKETIEIKTAEFTENHEELAENISTVKTSFSEKTSGISGSFDSMKSAVSEKKEDFTESFKSTMAEKKEELVESLGNMKSTMSGRKDSLAEKKEEKKRLQSEYDRLMENESFGSKRLMKAFPGMKSKSYQETLTKWKNYRNGKKEK